MIKKFKFTHFMPFALAVFVTIVIVIACGKGTLEDVKDLDNKKYVDDATKCLFEENSKSRCKLKDYDSLDSLVETPYSSSKSEKSSSSDENDDSSSSRNASGSSSSNNAQSSSSLVQSSSSVEYPYILSCKVKVGYDTGTVRKPIPKKNMPEVKCTEKKDSTKVTTLDPDADIYWTNNPRWSNPTDIKDYNDIRAKVDSDDNKKPCQGESVKCEGTFRICPEVGCPVLSSSSPAPSSSTAVVVSSSSVASAVSSSSRASSSSVAAVSSSSAAVSSSSSTTTTYTLACAAVPASGTAGTAINAPAVTCSGTAVNSGLTWTSTPTNINWSNPAANTYTSIKASASSGNCSGQTATCSGQLVVSPAPVTYTLACAAVPTSGTAGTAITPPAVTCSGTAVNSGLTWTSTPTNISWSNPTANTYTSIKASASSGNCSGQTATCSGQLVVSAPAVTYTLACTGLPATGKAGE
ncbi:MAG: hypothetical protein FWF63_02035, partial [Fibromonadales bacterium]|nr:hypothetical protein [Fibromonadales bacterium]